MEIYSTRQRRYVKAKLLLKARNAVSKHHLTSDLTTHRAENSRCVAGVWERPLHWKAFEWIMLCWSSL